MVTVRSSVIALNAAPAAPDAGGAFTSGGGNFVGAGDFATGFTAGGDRVGTAAAPLDPRLLPLTINGGPTLTRLPKSDSPLVDRGAGPTEAGPADQRGLARVAGAGINVGAVERQPGDPATPPVVALPTFTTGSDAGGVRSLNRDGTERFRIDPGFSGGRVIEADVTGDGVPDIVVGTAPGVVAQVKVFDSVTRHPLADLRPFEEFTGGVDLATGDLDEDGRAELVVTPNDGGGPRVVVFRNGDFARVANYFGIDDPRFRGGARATVGEINHDGRPDLIVAAGLGGGPCVTAYDGATVTRDAPAKLFDIFVFPDVLRDGANVAVGDVNEDDFVDLIAGAGPGGTPQILVLSGADLAAGRVADPAQLASFYAGNETSRAGVRVAVKDLDGDARADLVTAGDGATQLLAYRGADLSAGAFDPSLDFDAFPGTPGGVFVG